jgi:N-acetylmuramoyl-L-alanine amidase
VLNSRICQRVEEKLKAYSGYSLLRTDDVTGETLIKLADRIKAANDYNADIYVSVHHNAGIYGESGGGIIAFTYPVVDDYTKQCQKLLYDKLIEKTGLKGNRATPLATADFYELRETKMPAVLLECGFMDSSVDAPIIITEAFSDACAEAIVEALVELGNLKIKETPQPSDKLYRVQVGAYKVKQNAIDMQNKLKAAGFDAIIKES